MALLKKILIKNKNHCKESKYIYKLDYGAVFNKWRSPHTQHAKKIFL